MKTVAVVQARMNSTRLPGKVMREVCGAPLFALLLQRLRSARRVDEIVVATTLSDTDDVFCEFLKAEAVATYRGSESDVLDRYYRAALAHDADFVVRITGDCPLVDPAIVDDIVQQLRVSGVDYVSNTNPPSFPDGLDVEAFTMPALARAWREAATPAQREHVTPFMKQQPDLRRINVVNSTDLSASRWTVDEPEDLQVVKRIFEHFSPDIHFDWRSVANLELRSPALFDANRDIVRNEGMTMGTGQKLWKRAKRVIPGGNMLLSKRAEMFLPDRWPAYFSKAKGCHVWDLDGRKYLDMSIMGIGTNVLGYGQDEVDTAVRGVIDAGNMSTFNCPEEVYLAERLVELNPWSEMVRFARTGGEANAIALRIARAATGRDKVAICGYHGWHDWYLAANLGDEANLAGHLLPGLEANGVPGNLRGSVLPFQYNDLAGLDKLVREHSLAAIFMEVSRNVAPAAGFLEGVRRLATENGIVLIFDECTSGFRQALGGLHQVFGIEPDMAMYGKALGNGYAITAAVGRREVMEAAQGTFISSTFWTERIGPAAALKTLEVMQRERSWEYITTLGREIGARWVELGRRHGLGIELTGLPALIGFAIPVPDMLKYRTLVTQEMLKQGILAATAVYVCTAHERAMVDRYFEQLDPIFSLIADCEAGRRVIDELLEGPVCHAGFKRLN
ncbi:MAG: aminotransferase class III-fold pyridoxal phosphate-dependent enzyme [Pseudomonadota bacterium]